MQIDEFYAPHHPMSIFIKMFSKRVDETSEKSEYTKTRKFMREEVETNMRRMIFSPRESSDLDLAKRVLSRIAKDFGASNRYVNIHGTVLYYN